MSTYQLHTHQTTMRINHVVISVIQFMDLKGFLEHLTRGDRASWNSIAISILIVILKVCQISKSFLQKQIKMKDPTLAVKKQPELENR